MGKCYGGSLHNRHKPRRCHPPKNNLNNLTDFHHAHRESGTLLLKFVGAVWVKIGGAFTCGY